MPVNWVQRNLVKVIANHQGHITLFLLEIIRILPQTSTPFRNDDITIFK